MKTGNKDRDFRDLFEYVMVDVCSEAMAETVGSVMNMHCGGGGRRLQAENFSKEIFIIYHLPPMESEKEENLIKYVLKRRILEEGARYRRKLEKNRPDNIKTELGRLR